MKPIAIVLKPMSKEGINPGRGFSLKEVKESGQKLSFLKSNGIIIDIRRRSCHPQNVESLKNFNK